MASPSWKDEVESMQSIFPDELQVVEEGGCLLKYSIKGSSVLSIKLDGMMACLLLCLLGYI